jgi:uncharacterized coiled-coil protein SlyX
MARALTSRLLAGVAFVGVLSAAGAASAQTAQTQASARSPEAAALAALEQRIDALEHKVREQQDTLDSQSATLTAQAQMLRQQQTAIAERTDEIAALKSWRDFALSQLRAGGPGESAVVQNNASAPQSAGAVAVAQAPTGGPVGEAPPAQPTANLNASLPPDNTGVLTRRGHFTIEPSLTYSLSSSDRLVFDGVEIITGIQIGVIEADNAQRNTGIGTFTARYGLTDRSEIEVKIPYLYRRDVVTTLQQRDQSISTTQELNASNIGDVEFTGRYQLNGAGGAWPIIVGNLRVKSDSGTSPFTVPRDQYGVALGLATGSGFWGVEPSFSFLYPSDPVVLFGNISYLHNFAANINRNIGGAYVGRVTPGDSPGITGGFAFSLNPQFSFSLGYRHNYIFGTNTELSGTNQRSIALQVGSLLFGTAYALNSRYTLNAQLEMGVTRDAPDVTFTLRLPISF